MFLCLIHYFSEKKSHVQEHKEFLERQDQQVKNVMQLCMRTIKVMKSEQVNINPLSTYSRFGLPNLL